MTTPDKGLGLPDTPIQGEPSTLDSHELIAALDEWIGKAIEKGREAKGTADKMAWRGAVSSLTAGKGAIRWMVGQGVR